MIIYLLLYLQFQNTCKIFIYRTKNDEFLNSSEIPDEQLEEMIDELEKTIYSTEENM